MTFMNGWYRSLRAGGPASVRFIPCDARTGHCRSVGDLAALHAQSPLLAGQEPELDADEPTGGAATLVLMAPDHLALPAARALASSVAPGEVRLVRSVRRGEVIALIGSAASLRRVVHAGTLMPSSVGDQAVEEVLVSEDRILDPGPDGDRGLFGPDDAWHLPEAAIRSFAFVRLSGDPLAPTYACLPFWSLLRRNAPIGAVARLLVEGVAADVVPDGEPRLTRSDIDVVAVTTDRRRCVTELLRSIRDVLGPDPAVTVVVQSPDSASWRRLGRRYDATLVHVESDSGLAWSRNHAIGLTTRPLILLMDDDFQLDERCRIDDALSILDRRPDLGVLGGNLLDVETWSDGRDREVSQGFAMRMLEGPPDLVWLRLEDAPRQREYLTLTDYVECCDIVDNFALFRRADVFDRGVQWNPALKIGAEHQDLYVRLRSLGGLRVARTNALKVRNVRVQSARFRRMRSRTDRFFPIFFRDLGLTSFRIVGERLRVRSEDGGHLFQQGLGGELRYVGTGGRR